MYNDFGIKRRNAMRKLLSLICAGVLACSFVCKNDVYATASSTATTQMRSITIGEIEEEVINNCLNVIISVLGSYPNTSLIDKNKIKNIVQGEQGNCRSIKIPKTKEFDTADEAITASKEYELTAEKSAVLNKFLKAFVDIYENISAEALGFMAACVITNDFRDHVDIQTPPVAEKLNLNDSLKLAEDCFNTDEMGACNNIINNLLQNLPAEDFVAPLLKSNNKKFMTHVLYCLLSAPKSNAANPPAQVTPPAVAASSSTKQVIPGLRNLSNSCYLNCIMQSLHALNGFRNFIEKSEGSKSKIHNTLKDLFQKMDTETSFLDDNYMRGFYNNIRTGLQDAKVLDKEFRHNTKPKNAKEPDKNLPKGEKVFAMSSTVTQEDASEFLNLIFNGLAEEKKRESANWEDFCLVSHKKRMQSYTGCGHTWESAPIDQTIVRITLDQSTSTIEKEAFINSLKAPFLSETEQTTGLCEKCYTSDDNKKLCSDCDEFRKKCKNRVSKKNTSGNLLNAPCVSNKATTYGDSYSEMCLACKNKLDLCNKKLDHRNFKCAKKVKDYGAGFQQTLALTHLSPVLIVQLLRSDDKKKIKTLVDFSGAETLRIPYGEEGQQKTYRLRAIVAHGGSRDLGHYWAYVRGNGDNWYCQDDSNSKLVGDFTKVAQDAKESAFIFFYEQVNN
jgi:ubiquitin C-terminal hydrolase